MTANRVQPWLDDGDLRLYHGDSLDILRTLPAGIAQTCVTSPPYWGLRDYGTGQWTGGDETCDHTMPSRRDAVAATATSTLVGSTDTQGHLQEPSYRDVCGRCGARRVDSQLGLEATPTQYVENMVALFREVRRVLRDDGTLWLNLGDSYASGGAGNTTTRAERGESASFRQGGKAQDAHYETSRAIRAAKLDYGVKPKDLVGIPWRVAFALQADGWYLRSDIIWSKPNPMPESVTDRPTKAHEYLFLFSKQPRYFYDADAIRESDTGTGGPRIGAGRAGGPSTPNAHEPTIWANGSGRNRRSVWTIPTQPFPEAHFATYPEELVRPCILAGTSEKGECVECGAPWRRQTDVTQELLTGSPGKIGDGARHPDARTDLPSDRTRKHVETLGWEPSCNCRVWDPFLGGLVPLDEEPFVGTRPQLVLDPFIGSGTTSLVARKHGRRSIGIDLSADYLAIAAKRTQQLSLLGGVA